VNRGRRPVVHGGMNRPDMYIAQLTAQAAWLRAQGDDEGAALAEELADRFNTRHEGVLDTTTPTWLGTGDALDVEPAIRCWPEVGCVFEGDDGPYLTIDPMDGGDVSIVHMGDIVRWMSSRIDADEQATRAAGEAQAKLDAERVAYDVTVGSGYAAGEVIDAEFEVTPEEWVTLKPGEPVEGDLADQVLLEMVDEAIDEDDDAFARFNAARAASIPDEMSLLDEDDAEDAL